MFSPLVDGRIEIREGYKPNTQQVPVRRQALPGPRFTPAPEGRGARDQAHQARKGAFQCLARVRMCVSGRARIPAQGQSTLLPLGHRGSIGQREDRGEAEAPNCFASRRRQDCRGHRASCSPRSCQQGHTGRSPPQAKPLLPGICLPPTPVASRPRQARSVSSAANSRGCAYLPGSCIPWHTSPRLRWDPTWSLIQVF